MTDDFSNTKLVIEGFKKSDFSGSPVGTYTVMINPESYKLSTKVKYEGKMAKGNWSTNQKFQAIEPQELKLKFTIDGTGVTGAPIDTGTGNSQNQEVTPESVQKSIDWLLKVCRDTNGDTHQPNFVKVCWADLLFKGVFVSADINYAYFHRSGKPLRAVVDATFAGSIDDEARTAKEKKKSPDVTHVHTVKRGETLPLLSEKIYGKPDYYLDVAQVNGLENFRRLIPGQQLFFPPLSKTKENG